MSSSDLLRVTAGAALVVHVVLLGVCVFRVVLRGDNLVDRLLGAELVATLTLGVLVLLAILERDSIFIDVAVGLAAMGFVSTVALAKFLADERIF